MASTESNTISISRSDLKRALVAFGMSNKSIEELLSAMERNRRHMNMISFAAFAEHAGVSRQNLVPLLRKLGVSGIAIHNILELLDAYKIGAEGGKVFTATVELGEQQ